MSETIKVLCYRSKTLSNGEHPFMLCVCKDRKRKFQSLGISIKAELWDFKTNQPKTKCPNRERITILINDRINEIQKAALDKRIAGKDFTATTLIESTTVFSAENIQRLEFILQHANHRPGCILRNQTDKLLVKPMIEAIIREYLNKKIYSSEIITQLINTIVIVVARNIALFLPEQIDENSEEKSLNILQYIQSNICYPEKIKAKTISQHFGISPNYLGRYFKKQTNETMQQYIFNYKMQMAESRLLHSEMRISEIVEELGFTDESHLNKLFKKYKGCNPTDFRKRYRL
jgi:AraC-like DNA-binding protein